MNCVNTNNNNNFISLQGIKKTEENFKKLESIIQKRDLIIYRQILYLIDNCRTIEEDSTGIIVEIDLEEHIDLLKDITNNFFTKRLGERRYREKINHAYVIGNLFITIKIYNGF